ncbi:MurR/RpiR family transcriptional regulator [Paracoccaceae bacterium Fryx2]|nr:MurR/RpiR family transcriptional regulator [Paracoccaceae bacterium Fryx2]
MGRVDGQQAAEPSDLAQRLSASMTTATRTERAIAGYMLTNLKSLPFETAASVAQKIGVSEASIGRYCRAIGLAHFKDLKSRLQDDLGDKAWLIGDRLRDFHARSRNGDAEAARALELELAAIVAVHDMAAGPEFARTVARLAACPAVHVAGFQTERCHAMQLANGLHYLRPGVHLADLAGGNFAEILLADPAKTCLVLIDGRRYSRLTWKLAVDARGLGIPVTLITDPYCDWGRGVATEMFAVPTDLNHFWDATSAMASLIGLMVNGVFNQLGAGVEARMARVSSLYGDFIGHTGDPRTTRKQTTPTGATP